MSRGFSTIVGPDGEILAGPLVEEEGILYAEIDAARARASRHQFDPVGHYSRPDVFQLVVQTHANRPVVNSDGARFQAPPPAATSSGGGSGTRSPTRRRTPTRGRARG
jgi:nitrilase